MKISEYRDWIISSSSLCYPEYRGLITLLEELDAAGLRLEFTPIDLLEDELGLELFFNGKKIAEVYCAEDRTGLIEGIYLVHTINNWAEARFFDINETVEAISLCEVC